MKKILLTALAALCCLAASAQGQITTKKNKISDFTSKTLKIVLSGNTIDDLMFKDDVAAHWKISPYEFCTNSEFESLKTSADYYFMMKVTGQFRKEKEPGLVMLTVVKGGPEAAAGLGSMLEVVTIPISSVQDPSGRDQNFMGAFLDIMQEHIVSSMESDWDGYGGLGNNNINLSKNRKPSIVLARQDLCKLIDDRAVCELEEYNITVLDDVDDVDDYMLNCTPDTFVGFCVYPAGSPAGSWCYKMLIDAGTHKLVFYKRHKISKGSPAGFLPEDTKRMKDSRDVE